jgi:glyoxylase-like metal-dependent hydrolase (beta-lactamase superfamily II)
MSPEPEHPLAAPAPGLIHPWPEPPEGGASILVAPGIRWIRMPLPFQLNHINLWLVEEASGWTIVDTGINTEATRELWDKIFAE